MPAHRSPSTTVRTQAQQRPYKVPVIVISSDEEDEPRPPPPKHPRKHRRAKAEPEEVVEISEEKHEHLESERMQRRCYELEQVYAARFHTFGTLLIAYIFPLSKLLGTRYAAKGQ